MKCKKILAVLMATILFCGGLPAFSSLAADTTVNGDVNSDVTIDVRDLIRLKKYCASSNVDINISQSDWNGDGKINSDDVTRLRNWLVNPTEENAFVGLPSLFSTGNGTLTVTNTDSFPEVAFTNNNNENAYITIDDSCFKNEVTEYDSICFKVKYSTSGYLNATGLSVSVVTNDDIVIKTATSLDKNEEFDIRLSKEEMAIYKSNSNGIRIKLTATKTAIIGSYKYDLTLSDFCVVDEMNRFSCQKTEDVVYGTMGPAYDLQKSQYPFVAATYENDRWQRWSYVTIMDDDYIEDITKYDMLEFDVMIKTPITGEFDSVQLDLLYGSDVAKLKNSMVMKYDTWYHVSLSANEMYKYKTSGADLKFLLTVIGGAEDVNLLQMGYELCIDNFRLVENGNKAAFNNAETMFAHWQQTTERTVDLLEGTIVTGSTNAEFGADFYYGGDPNYGTMNKSYADGERTVVRITRGASGSSLWQGTAKFYVAIPEGTTIDKAMNFSMDAWFSDYAHPWTSVRLVTADKQAVTNLLSRDWASTRNSWQTSQWSVAGFTLQGDYTLQDAKYFEIWVNFNNDVNHAIEVRLDNLKVSEGKYSLVNHTTTSSLLSVSDTINGRDDVVAK